MHGKYSKTGRQKVVPGIRILLNSILVDILLKCPSLTHEAIVPLVLIQLSVESHLNC